MFPIEKHAIIYTTQTLIIMKKTKKTAKIVSQAKPASQPDSSAQIRALPIKKLIGLKGLI